MLVLAAAARLAAHDSLVTEGAIQEWNINQPRLTGLGRAVDGHLESYCIRRH